jgi:hypothetical protein
MALTANPARSPPPTRSTDGGEEHWRRLHAQDPELAGLLHASAHAARALALEHYGSLGYQDWLREYQRLGDLLADLYARRRAARSTQEATP